MVRAACIGLMLTAGWAVAQQPVIYKTWGERQLKGDLYLPAAGASGPVPAVVYIHGGGWRAGNRNQFERHAQRMAELGFVGLTVEYRFQQEAKWPAAMDDVTAAVDWLKANAKKYNIDVRRLGAAGGSAGGQLAAMLGVRAKVKAVAAFNPALDMIALAGHVQLTNSVSDYLGVSFQERPALWKEASPIEHVSKKSAAFLFLHGDADMTVPYAHTVRMRELLRKAGVTADLFTAEKAAHGFFNKEPWFQPTLDRMISFYQHELH